MVYTKCVASYWHIHGFILIVIGLLLLALVMLHLVSDLDDEIVAETEPSETVAAKNNGFSIEQQTFKQRTAADLVYYKKDIPLIWIGGVPRSGMTLMRAMLDAHGDIRCGEETRVIPRLLGMHSGIEKSTVEMTRLQEAKIDAEVLNSALGAYLLSIIAHHGDPAPHLCNKDAFTLCSMTRISVMFPKSKFLLMIRDGRATVHSIMSHKVSIKGFDTASYRGALTSWNQAISNMYSDCMGYGEKVCLLVHYEQLVLHPETQMRRILKFLDIPWDPNVLHHELSIIKNGVSLSR